MVLSSWLRGVRRMLRLNNHTDRKHTNTKHNNTMKKTYEKPLAELFEVQSEGSLMTGSAETMRAVTGSWDEDDEII